MVASWSTTSSRLPWDGQLLVESRHSWSLCAGALSEGLPALPAQDRGPVLASWPTPGADEYLDVLDIHLSRRLWLHGCRASRWTTGPRTHACERVLLFCGGSFPYSAVTSARLPQVTFAPGASTDRGKTSVPTAAGPASDHPGPPTR